MDLGIAVLLVIGVMICWVLNLIGLPGNWLLVTIAGLYAELGPEEGRLDFDWTPIGLLVVLALIGELIELVAGAWGTRRAGGSKRSAALALVGSLFGGILGAILGLPIPVVGVLVAAVLGAGIGAMAGAVAGERWKGREFEESWRVGEAAFWARLLGTLGKSLAGAIMVVVVLVAVIW